MLHGIALVTQLIITFVTLALATVPVAFVAEHTWATGTVGLVCTTTSYVAPVCSIVGNAKTPLTERKMLSVPSVTLSESPPARPTTVPPIV